MKCENRVIKATNLINGEHETLYLVNKVVWELVDEKTCNRLPDDKNFIDIDEERDDALKMANKVIDSN